MGIEFRKAITNPDEKINCRPVQICQVLLNLIINMRDSVEADSNSWIEVKSWSANSNAFISVTDSGVGIDEKVKAKIFAPFFTTKEVGKGTGLGLSISKQIIESHGGSLTLNEKSENTCFVIRLPQKHTP